MKKLLRLAAITIASTALVATAGTVPASAAPGDSASIAVPEITLNNYKNTTTTTVPVTLTTSRASLTAVKATVNVNGVPVANDVYVGTSFTYYQAWGKGIVTLTNLKDYGNQPVAGGSNPATVRYGLESRFDNIRITKRGKKLTFKIKVRYINNAGRPVGVRKATVQVLKGRKWKTLKNVNLKKNGTKTFKKSDKKKRKYRLYIKTNSTYSGGTTKGIRI
jgi:hypothetical protein